MKIIRSINAITHPFPKAVVTIGNFDGVHLGHQALLEEVVRTAGQLDGTSVAMTFEPHPARYFRPEARLPLITLLEQKMELIAAVGIEVLICPPFDRSFADISADAFLNDLLVTRIGMRAIVVGKDYRFGKGRAGTLDMLAAQGKELGFEVITPDWVCHSPDPSERVSSTLIRERIMDGDMAHARDMLGRYYQIRGTVAHGRNRRGRLLGFPTANIHLQDELCPATGVYAVLAEVAGKEHWGVANIGYSPTFDDHQFTVEVHLLDFDQPIYDTVIRVHFVHRLRSEIRFDSIDALADQIRHDVVVARKFLAALPPMSGLSPSQISGTP